MKPIFVCSGHDVDKVNEGFPMNRTIEDMNERALDLYDEDLEEIRK